MEVFITEKKQMDKKIEWIDICKGILILLVILGHISFDTTHINPTTSLGWSYLRSWIYSFHIPAFFVINGILKNKHHFEQRTYSFLQLLIKQKKVFVYYVVFSVIFFLRYVAQMIFGINTSEDVLLFVINTVSFVGMAALWFLPTFIFAQLIFYYYLKSGKIFKIIIFTILLFSLFVPSLIDLNNISTSHSIQMKLTGVLNRSLVATFFITIGYYLNKYSLFDSKYSWLSLFSFFCCVNGIPDLNKMIFNNTFFYVVFSVFGTMLTISVSKIIVRFNFKNIFIEWGKGSLFIMCTHTVLLVLQSCQFLSLQITRNFVFDIIFTFLLAVLIETILYRLFTRIDDSIMEKCFKSKMEKKKQYEK